MPTSQTPLLDQLSKGIPDQSTETPEFSTYLNQVHAWALRLAEENPEEFARRFMDVYRKLRAREMEDDPHRLTSAPFDTLEEMAIFTVGLEVLSSPDFPTWYPDPFQTSFPGWGRTYDLLVQSLAEYYPVPDPIKTTSTLAKATGKWIAYNLLQTLLDLVPFSQCGWLVFAMSPAYEKQLELEEQLALEFREAGIPATPEWMDFMAGVLMKLRDAGEILVVSIGKELGLEEEKLRRSYSYFVMALLVIGMVAGTADDFRHTKEFLKGVRKLEKSFREALQRYESTGDLVPLRLIKEVERSIYLPPNEEKMIPKEGLIGIKVDLAELVLVSRGKACEFLQKAGVKVSEIRPIARKSPPSDEFLELSSVKDLDQTLVSQLFQFYQKGLAYITKVNPQSESKKLISRILDEGPFAASRWAMKDAVSQEKCIRKASRVLVIGDAADFPSSVVAIGPKTTVWYYPKHYFEPDLEKMNEFLWQSALKRDWESFIPTLNSITTESLLNAPTSERIKIFVSTPPAIFKNAEGKAEFANMDVVWVRKLEAQSPVDIGKNIARWFNYLNPDSEEATLLLTFRDPGALSTYATVFVGLEEKGLVEVVSVKKMPYDAGGEWSLLTVKLTPMAKRLIKESRENAKRMIRKELGHLEIATPRGQHLIDLLNR